MTPEQESTHQLDVVGSVMTVAGPVPADALGVTLMHEHLFIDLRRTHLPHPESVAIPGRLQPISTSADYPATELAISEAKLGPENLDEARAGGPVSDNYVLADEDLATQEVMEFQRRGGGAIVDVTSIGLKRDAAALLRVSRATKLNIVMGTAFYRKVYHPYDMDDRTVDNLTEEIVRDVTIGVGDTGIRAGIIGEVGVNGAPIGDNEVKSIQAAGRAGARTGAPISIHRGGRLRERHRTLDLIAAEGVDLSRVVLGHSDEISTDIPLVLEMAERGVYIEFDLLGRDDLPPNALPESEYKSGAGLKQNVGTAILELAKAGYEDRVVLSHDVCWKTHLKEYGGFGYSYILEEFLDYLHEIGLTEAQTDKFMIENPKSVLPFVEPV